MAKSKTRTKEAASVSYSDTSGFEDHQESFGHLVRDVHRYFTRTLHAFVTEHEITSAQWFFLRALWDEDGLSQAELSERVGLTTATTVIALNTLADKGLVERRKHPSDGRKFLIKLTSRGRNIEQKLRPRGKQVNDLASAGIPKDMLQNTRTVLQRMRANLRKSAAAESNGDD